MKVLLLGVGLQGKAALYDLERSPLVTEVLAADRDLEAVNDFIAQYGLEKASSSALDAGDEDGLAGLLASSGAQVVVCMLPPRYGYSVARAAIDTGMHFVSASYAGDLRQLDGRARKAGVVILPEMGFDPGIDLILGWLAVEELDEVHGLYSYGSGVPEPACADHNPLRYKITWSFEGVLDAYRRPARLLKDGREISIPSGEIFREDNIHSLEIPGVGRMEAYPNGDAISFVETFGLGSCLRHMGRFKMRWPGHCRFWNQMSELGFLSDETLKADGYGVSPFKFLVEHLASRLQYAEGEKDMVVLRIHAWGVKDGKQTNVIYELIDRRDLQTGFFAMNRTVGFTASIAAQMILEGSIQEPGVLSPVRHVPSQKLLEELERRNIQINYRCEG